MKFKQRNFGRVFTGLLFALFVVALMMALLAGTSVYRALYQAGEESDNQRLSLALLANAVRANDQIDAVARAWVTGDEVELEFLSSNEESAELDALPIFTQISTDDGTAGGLLQSPTLVLRETLESGVYETRIYLYDGMIMEEYALAGAPYDPEKATPIVASSQFGFSYSGGLLTISTDAGDVSVALRSDCRGGQVSADA